METLLSQIRNNPRIRVALEDSFDFIIAPSTYDASRFRIEPPGRVEPIATDASGGVFLTRAPDQRIIHVTSEGQAGVVARDLREFLTILVTFPYWLTLLNFSGGGKLEEMQNAVKPLEVEAQSGKYAFRLERNRRLLIEQLDLRSDPAIIIALHTAVGELGRDLRILGPDGSEYDSLFNKFPASRLRRPPPRS
jgi:hypothetical protein